jgi:hypothetical protein
MVAVGRVDDAKPEQRTAGKNSSVWVLLTDSRAELDVIVRSGDASADDATLAACVDRSLGQSPQGAAVLIVQRRE